MKWQNSPLLRLVLPFTLGMVGAILLPAPPNPQTLFILSSTALALTHHYVKTAPTHQSHKFGIAATLLYALIGMTLHTAKQQRITQGIPPDTHPIQGILAEPPQEKAKTWALNLMQDNGTHIIVYIGKERGKEEGKIAALQAGDTILARIRHLAPTESGGGIFAKYRRYLFHQDICATAYAPPRQWQVKPRHATPGILQSFKDLQEKLHHIYEANGISQEASSIIEAMTIGRKGEIPKATRTAYARAGVSHVLALSGFHVGIIAMMMQFFFLKKMLPRRWQWVSNTLIIAALWCYALMTGMSPSLVRAVIMFSLLLLSQMLSRENITLNSCALAFFLMLCINPFLLHDIGFQLSFISVCSISLFNKQLIRTCPSRSPFILTLWTTIGITFICSLFTAPLVAHHFGNIPILSIISNLAILPFVYLLMWGSILWWAFLWSPSINAVLTELLNWTATTMNSITETIATLPFSTIEWHPDALVTILCYTALLILTLGLQKYPPTTQSPINNNIFSHIRRHIHKK